MIRDPVVAGMFYPSDPNDLRRDVARYINDSGQDPDPLVKGLVCPHAGYVYSGAVAGVSYSVAPDEIDTVVIVAPAHRYPVYGASVFGGEGYRTPLGTASINSPVVQRLNSMGLKFDSRAHSSEHSTEVQVPFIQYRWPEADLVVIIQGDSSEQFSRDLAGKLDDALADTENVLLVASTDLSHYHAEPAANEMDAKVIEAFVSGDPEKLRNVLAHREGEACGGGPMLVLMHWAAANQAQDFRKLEYATSARASGDTSAVVGYFAGAVAGKA